MIPNLRPNPTASLEVTTVEPGAAGIGVGVYFLPPLKAGLGFAWLPRCASPPQPAGGRVNDYAVEGVFYKNGVNMVKINPLFFTGEWK
ncbi:hypothetical protein ES708_28231 [subsurface metagenome]